MKHKRPKTLSPHKILSKEALKELRKQQRKEWQDIKRQETEATLAIYRSMSDQDLIGICAGCYKNCPCEAGELRDKVMKERSLL